MKLVVKSGHRQTETAEENHHIQQNHHQSAVLGEERRREHRIDGQLGGAAHKGGEEDGHLPVPLAGMQSMKNLEQVNMQSMVVEEKVIGFLLLIKMDNQKHQKVGRHTPRKKQDA